MREKNTKNFLIKCKLIKCKKNKKEKEESVMIQLLDENDKAQTEQKIKTVSDETNSLKEDLAQLELVESIDLSTANNGFINQRGSIITQYGGYKYTNAIPVKRGQTVVVNAQGYSTNVAIISMDLNGTIKPLVLSIDSTFRKYEY